MQRCHQLLTTLGCVEVGACDHDESRLEHLLRFLRSPDLNQRLPTPVQLSHGRSVRQPRHAGSTLNFGSRQRTHGRYLASGRRPRAHGRCRTELPATMPCPSRGRTVDMSLTYSSIWLHPVRPTEFLVIIRGIWTRPASHEFALEKVTHEQCHGKGHDSKPR